MKYKKMKIDDSFLKYISKWSKDASCILDYCLNNSLWIAGGFAREVYRINVIKENADIKIENYFFNKSGDIDLFGKKADLVYNTEYFANTESNNDFTFHESLYTSNIVFSCVKKLREKDKLNSAIRSGIALQIVNKIDHENIFDCLASFDITNSKYCIYKENNNFFLTFDEDAEYYDSRKELDISHSDTPYLAQRVTKYIKRKDLNKISKRSRDKIKEFFVNVISNKWNKHIKVQTFNELSNIHADIIRLDKIIKLTEEEIIIMLGKINTLIYNDDYTYFVSKDWASETILRGVKNEK